MKSTKLDLALKAGIAALLIALALVIYSTTRDRITDVGDTAPSFSITTDQGHRITPADFGGRVLVLNFWATWCAPCVQEVPSLSEFQKRMAGSGVVVVGLSVDKNPNLYSQFLKRFNPAFQTARDPAESIPNSYGTYRYPETYVIDRSGKVVQKVIGSRNWIDPDNIASFQSL
ncbi:MAG TPA: TlpA disulfide reductase family protein [Bryobacteraceae bacterium]|nr:TlpA disulfide reductase family protein [Bryobacteraceae bacterium]